MNYRKQYSDEYVEYLEAKRKGLLEANSTRKNWHETRFGNKPHIWFDGSTWRVTLMPQKGCVRNHVPWPRKFQLWKQTYDFVKKLNIELRNRNANDNVQG